MLFNVPAAMSSLGFPATVTRPDLTGCLNGERDRKPFVDFPKAINAHTNEEDNDFAVNLRGQSISNHARHGH
jgi:hypothetical protein